MQDRLSVNFTPQIHLIILISALHQAEMRMIGWMCVCGCIPNHC